MGAAMIPLAVMGTVISVYGKMKAGDIAERNSKIRASQLEKAAGLKKATSQRVALEEERQGRLKESRALAVAAASGGGSDPTVMNLIAKMAGETNYRKMTALYEGETESGQMKAQAEDELRAGKDAKQASRIQALSSLMGGASSMYSKYGFGGPNSSGTPSG